MMRKFVRKISFLLLTLTLKVSAVEKLPSEYLVSYGQEGAPIEIVQFYSLSCPHCLQLFNHDFPLIKQEFIEKGRLRYVFHPAPMDLSTVQFMCCLEKLGEEEKRLLLSVLFEELSLDNPEFNIILMKKAMELLGKPIEELHVDEYIKNSQAFENASRFVLQDDKVKVIPSILVGQKLLDKVPDYPFITTIINRFIEKDSEYVN